MNKTIIFFTTIVLLCITLIFTKSNVTAQQYCSQLNSTNSARLNGQITDNGGIPNITVWFNWKAQNSSSWNQTPSQNLQASSVPYNFHYDLSNLQPCTTYEYKALASNSFGNSEGEIQCFRTACIPLEVRCAASPNPARINQTVTFIATTNGGNPPYAYSWSGACAGSSNSCQRVFNNTGSFTAYLTVRDYSGNTRSTQCSVNVQGSAPRVITLPPVETL